MNYTTFNATKFTRGITESLDQTIAQPSAWAIEALTSPAAQKRYALLLEIGQRLAEILRLVVLATIASIDEYIEDCQSRPEDPQPPEVVDQVATPKTTARRISKDEVKAWLEGLATEAKEFEGLVEVPASASCGWGQLAVMEWEVELVDRLVKLRMSSHEQAC